MTRHLIVKYDGNALVPQEPVDLPVGTELRVTVEAPSTREAGDPNRLLSWLDEQGPIEGYESPGDASIQHDHYLYGTPKRNDP